MHIRFLVESESPEHARTFDVWLRDATQGDGQDAAFRALVTKRAGLTAEQARDEVVRLRALGHNVTGDRAAKSHGLLES